MVYVDVCVMKMKMLCLLKWDVVFGMGVLGFRWLVGCLGSFL